MKNEIYEIGKSLGLEKQDIDKILSTRSTDASGMPNNAAVNVYKAGTRYGTVSSVDLYKAGAWYGSISIKDF